MKLFSNLFGRKQNKVETLSKEELTTLNSSFFKALGEYSIGFPFSEDLPQGMITSKPNKDNWVKWKPIEVDISLDLYRKIDNESNITLPNSFIQWHKSHYFAECDCSLLRLPNNLPPNPAQQIEDFLNSIIGENLLPKGLIPFAQDGNDGGVLVFDINNDSKHDCPIRFYNYVFIYDTKSTGTIIFSSFAKLLECITHFMNGSKGKESFDIIPDFFKIDPNGAGKKGRKYWKHWIKMERGNYKEFMK